MAAGPLLAYSLTDDPLLVGLAAFFQALPWFLFSLVSGALVDRLDRKRVMGIANYARAAVLAVLGVAVLLNVAVLPLLYAALFVLGLSETFFDNASQTMLPAVVAREDLEKANGRLEGARIVANDLVGPPLGSVLFGVVAAMPFLLNAGAFAASAALVLALRGSFRAADDGRAAAPVSLRVILSAVREGLGWLARHRLFGPLATISALLGLVDAGVLAVFVIYVRETLGLASFAYGVLLAVGALGGIAAGLVADRLVSGLGTGTAIFLSLALGAASYAGIALAGSVVVVGAMMIVNGFHLVLWNVTTLSLRQGAIPDALLGRVNSAYRFATMTGVAAGPVLAGLLATAVGLVGLFWAAAVLLAAGSAMALAVANNRRTSAARSG